MIFKVLVLTYLVLVQVTFAQHIFQDLYKQNVPAQNTQQYSRRFSRQTNNLPSNVAINSNVPLNGVNNGIPIMNSAWQNIPQDNTAANLLQNVNNLNIPNPRVNSFSNRLLSNTNGMINNGWLNSNTLPGNGFHNNNLPNSLPNGNRIPFSNLVPNSYNGQINNGIPNLNRVPRTDGFINTNSFTNSNLVPNFNSMPVSLPTNLQNFNSLHSGILDPSSHHHLPNKNLINNNNLADANFLRDGNLGASNYPHNNLPIGNMLPNSFNLPASTKLSNLQFITSDQAMLSNFPSNNGGLSQNIPNNNYLINGVSVDIPSGNIISPFMIRGDMPLHTIVPNLNNLASVSFSTTGTQNDQIFNKLSSNDGGSMHGSFSNNLPIMKNFQYDLASKQDKFQSLMPSFSNFQQENQLDLANSFNMVNRIQMDSLGNMVKSNNLPVNVMSDNL